MGNLESRLMRLERQVAMSKHSDFEDRLPEDFWSVLWLGTEPSKEAQKLLDQLIAPPDFRDDPIEVLIANPEVPRVL